MCCVYFGENGNAVGQYPYNQNWSSTGIMYYLLNSIHYDQHHSISCIMQSWLCLYCLWIMLQLYYGLLFVRENIVFWKNKSVWWLWQNGTGYQAHHLLRVSFPFQVELNPALHDPPVQHLLHNIFLLVGGWGRLFARLFAHCKVVRRLRADAGRWRFPVQERQRSGVEHTRHDAVEVKAQSRSPLSQAGELKPNSLLVIAFKYQVTETKSTVFVNPGQQVAW